MTTRAADDDLLLEQFFQSAREQEIADRGFTQRVMRQLPGRSLQLSHWWTALCLAVGLVLFVAFKGWQPLLVNTISLLHNIVVDVKPIPLFVTIGIFCSLTLLDLAHRMERLA